MSNLRRMQFERLLYVLEQREKEAFEKLLPQDPNSTNFPFALMEWTSLASALEALRRRERTW